MVNLKDLITEDWWSKMSSAEQAEYIRKHPNSEKAQQAKKDVDKKKPTKKKDDKEKQKKGDQLNLFPDEPKKTKKTPTKKEKPKKEKKPKSKVTLSKKAAERERKAKPKTSWRRSDGAHAGKSPDGRVQGYTGRYGKEMAQLYSQGITPSKEKAKELWKKKQGIKSGGSWQIGGKNAGDSWEEMIDSADGLTSSWWEDLMGEFTKGMEDVTAV